MRRVDGKRAAVVQRSNRPVTGAGGTTATVKVSVIIPCRNAAATIGDQLEALAKQQFEEPWEVVVVDDDSSDRSHEVASSFADVLPSLTVVRNSDHHNVARVRNIGVRHAKGRHLLFCDADDVVGDGWLAAMSTALDTHEFVAGSSEVARLNDPWMWATREMPQQFGLQLWTNPYYLPHAGGGTLGMTRRLYDTVGPFEESPALRFAEAADYCFRAQLAGYPLQYVPEARIHVRLRPTILGLYRQARGWGESSVGVHRKFAAAGMPGPNWRRGLGAWVLAVPRLARVRTRADLSRWVYLHGWRVGRLRGSLRNRVLAV